MNSIYLRFLQSIASLDSHQNRLKHISPVAVLLLIQIAINELEKKPLSVTKAMKLKEIGSPSNLYHKLNELRDAGLIETKKIGDNKIVKYLFTTQATNDDFRIKSNVMLRVIGRKYFTDESDGINKFDVKKVMNHIDTAKESKVSK